MSRYGEALDNVLKDNPKPLLTTSDIHKSIRLLQEAIFKANMFDNGTKYHVWETFDRKDSYIGCYC